MIPKFIISKLPEEEQKILNEREWDVVIVGGGPAGYTAAIYCSRYKLKTLVITTEIGGLLNQINLIDDYPGLPEINGIELGKKFKEHAEKFGVKTLLRTVVRIQKENEKFKIITSNGEEIYSKSVIIATGSKRKKLDVPGENLPGISYCAECDGYLFKDKVVGVVGGGDSAFHDALVLAQHAKEVYIIHRKDEFKAQPMYIEEIKKNPKVKFILNKVVVEIKGNGKVEEVVLKDVNSGEISTLKLDGLFIAIGLAPVSEIVKDLNVNLDKNGNIIVDQCSKTNIPGLAAAGDVTNQICGFKQIITSAAQGAVAALSIFTYLKTGKW